MTLQEILVAQHDATEAAALSVDVFRCGMHDDVRAEIHRPLQRRCREGVIDDQPRAAIAGDLGDRRYVDNIKCWIGRGLQEQHLGRRRHRRAPLVEIAAVDQRMRHAEARQDVRDHRAARTEHRLRRDDMIAGAQA